MCMKLSMAKIIKCNRKCFDITNKKANIIFKPFYYNFYVVFRLISAF